MTHPAIPNPYPLPGEIIDGAWRVEKILGEGGMGAVALAWDLFLHTPVAIKFMNPQFLTFPGAEQRFLNEGRASALIKSDHVVPVTKAGKTASGTPFLVMEALEGLDLADVIARDGTPGLPVERAVHFVLQVLRALQAAHAIGIIHRDMKPSNCFAVVKDGEADFVKILDFGISKVQERGSASLTQTNSALGTPLYMSPEQARSPRDVDARSDLYSVGVILYELLTGHTPFFSESGEFTEILFKLFTADPPPVQTTRPEIPDALAAAVHKALARDVNDRFASAVEMAEAIAPWASERSENVLTRMRAFKAPPKGGGSIAPPADLPESMVAFSQIGATTGAADIGDAAPMRSVALTVPIANPGRVPAFLVPPILSDGAAGVPTSPPPALEARPLADGGARTEYASGADLAAILPREGVTGASTDLGAARDTSFGETSRKKRSPLVFALPLIAVTGMVVGAIAFSRSAAKEPVASATPPSAAIMPPAERSAATVVTPPPPVRIVAATATAPSGSAQASASASASASAARVPHRVDPAPHPVGSAHVLDTQIKN